MSWASGGHVVDNGLKLTRLNIYIILNLVNPKLQYRLGPGRRFQFVYRVGWLRCKLRPFTLSHGMF
jgi:hypothetical protein